MQIRHVVAFAQGMVTEFVGRAVHVALFQAGSGQPDRKTMGMMVAAVFAAVTLFQTRRPTEFGTEYHHGLFQQPPLLEVLDQAGYRFIELGTESCVIFFQFLMRVPSTVRRRIDLHETHAPLD
ncbi:MAG: hypothetical protein KatS3mg110_0157 [Pirellulaceae bacterium]|nr:MAG: hypothetical protein KatS3mg110_0157 [Pirellulaceae bacterium]